MWPSDTLNLGAVLQIPACPPLPGGTAGELSTLSSKANDCLLFQLAFHISLGLDCHRHIWVLIVL